MPKTISNTDKTLDSRSVIQRIDELQSDRDDLAEAVKDAQEALAEAETAVTEWDGTAEELVALEATRDEKKEELADAVEAVQTWDDDDDEGGELKRLKEFAEEAEGYTSEWRHGETLIHESYFTDYARETARDTTEALKDMPGWIVIDWEATAENLKDDYSQVSYGDENYYIRDC